MAKAISLITLIFGLLSHSFSIAAAPKIVLAHGALNARIAPLWIAHEQKFFSKYGVDSTVILVRQIQIMVSGLGTGEIDIALTSGSTLLGAAAGGLDAKIVAALNAKVTYDLVAAPGIKSPKDLRGKRFGIQAFGGGLWMGAMLGLEHLGLDPQRDNINILQIGDQSVIAQAIEAGSIDAAALDGVFSRKLKQKGFNMLAEFSQANIPTIGLGLVAKNGFIRERQDALEGVVKGLSESVAFILSPKYKPVVLKTIMQHLRIRDPATAEEGYQDLITGLDRKLLPSIDGLRNTQRLLKPRNPKLETIKVEELIDDRIIRKLDDSGFIARLQAAYGIK
ncbi:MAG: ABC transporter substrate-binding protein [Deltaproteobacteria bacterium]|jgi:ABC-type nitrate/sulfonate/bicarbonate transport system substrate-binding protein|nr:MAG: ABC transporter substrate-binding protein [Deltaproteobacteria bacterium]